MKLPNKINYSVYCIVGKKGAGKTSLINKLAETYSKNVIMYSARPNSDSKLPIIKNLNEYKGGKFQTDARYINYETFIRFCKINLKDTLIIIDDTRNFEKSRGTALMENFLIHQRGHRCDVILVYHAFYYITKSLFTYIDYFIAFKTNEPIEKKVGELPSANKIIDAYYHLQTSRKYTCVLIKA